jgi:hypothetical protein
MAHGGSWVKGEVLVRASRPPQAPPLSPVFNKPLEDVFQYVAEPE